MIKTDVRRRDLIKSCVPECSEDLPLDYNSGIHNPICMTLSSHGYDKKQIAETFGIKLTELNKWFEEYPELRFAFDKGQFNQVVIIESQLLRMCIPHSLKTTETTYDKAGELVKKVIIEKEVDPNYNAVIRYLMSKIPDVYRMGETVKEDPNFNDKIIISSDDQNV